MMSVSDRTLRTRSMSYCVPVPASADSLSLYTIKFSLLFFYLPRLSKGSLEFEKNCFLVLCAESENLPGFLSNMYDRFSYSLHFHDILGPNNILQTPHICHVQDIRYLINFLCNMICRPVIIPLLRLNLLLNHSGCNWNNTSSHPLDSGINKGFIHPFFHSCCIIWPTSTILSSTSSSLVSISFSFSSYWSNYTAVLITPEMNMLSNFLMMRFPFYWLKIPTCDPNIIPRRLLTSNTSFLVFICQWSSESMPHAFTPHRECRITAT